MIYILLASYVCSRWMAQLVRIDLPEVRVRWFNMPILYYSWC